MCDILDFQDVLQIVICTLRQLSCYFHCCIVQVTLTEEFCLLSVTATSLSSKLVRVLVEEDWNGTLGILIARG